MNAFLFVPLLALTWAFGLVLAMYCSHIFLGTLEATSAGNEEVEMPDDPFVEWLVKLVYFAFFVIIWSIPSLIFWAMTKGDSPSMRFLSLLIPFWFCFPIGILSSLSLRSRWVPFWPGLLERMSQRPNRVMQFYLLSFPIFLLFGYGFRMLTQGLENQILLFGFAPLTAAAFLVYARLIGRLGLVLTFTKGIPEGEPAPTKKKKKKRKLVETAVEQQPAHIQPSEMQGVQTPYDGELTGYDVDFDQKNTAPSPQEVTRRVVDDPDDDVQYEMVDGGLDAPKQMTVQQEQALKPPPQSELDLFAPAKKVKDPKSPFGSSVFVFLANPHVTKAWLMLSGGLALLSLMLFFLEKLRPV
jgi:hypothetical protein